MKRNLSLIALGLLVAMTLPLAAQADVLKLQPVKAVVLPADRSGLTRIALEFDFRGMRSGEGRRIDEAFLDWRVDGVPSDRHSEYEVYPITETWTAAGAAAGSAIATAADPAAFWEIEPLDYQRNGGGFIRLDLIDLVRGWVGEESNFGVLITTADVSRQAIADQLGKAVLTVRYGFIR
jgi:hypothetical protein